MRLCHCLLNICDCAKTYFVLFLFLVSFMQVKMMCSYCTRHEESEVPDPYYGGPQGFEKVSGKNSKKKKRKKEERILISLRLPHKRKWNVLSEQAMLHKATETKLSLTALGNWIKAFVIALFSWLDSSVLTLHHLASILPAMNKTINAFLRYKQFIEALLS